VKSPDSSVATKMYKKSQVLEFAHCKFVEDKGMASLTLNVTGDEGFIKKNPSIIPSFNWKKIQKG